MSRRDVGWCIALALISFFGLLLIASVASAQTTDRTPMSEPARVARDEIVTRLITQRDAGKFDALLATYNTASGLSLTTSDIQIASTYLPLSKLDNLSADIWIQLAFGWEGNRQNAGKTDRDEMFALDVFVETDPGSLNIAAIDPLVDLSRRVADFIWFDDPDASQPKRRRLTGVDAMVKTEMDLAKFDPASLLQSSVFSSWRHLQFEAVT